jgi:hypothetical protein
MDGAAGLGFETTSGAGGKFRLQEVYARMLSPVTRAKNGRLR